MKNKANTIEYNVPAFLVSYFIYSDDSGLEPNEKIAADKFLEDIEKTVEQEFPDNLTWHLSADSNEETFFVNFHDVAGVLPTNCQTLTVVVLTEKDYEENEMENEDDFEWIDISNFSFQGLPVEKIQLTIENMYSDLEPDSAMISEVKSTRKDGRIKFEGNFVVKFTAWDSLAESTFTRDVSFNSFMEFPDYWNEEDFVGQLLALIDYWLYENILSLENNVFGHYAYEIESGLGDVEILARFDGDTLYLKIA